MENELAATQPEQPTTAPVTAESAPAQEQATPAQPPVDTQKPNAQETEPEWFTKRFGEITAKFRDAERRAITAEQQLAQERAARQPKEPEKVKTLADFDYDEGKFQAYVVEQARAAARTAALDANNEQLSREQAAKRFRKFQEREIAFEKGTKDYREVAHYAPISESIAQVIQDMDNGPEIAYHLGKNRDIALSLNDLPPHIAAIELGRIDERLSAERKAKAAALEAAKAAKAVTSAPPPAPQLEGSNAQVDKDPSQMSDAEFAKWRRKQIAQRR